MKGFLQLRFLIVTGWYLQLMLLRGDLASGIPRPPRRRGPCNNWKKLTERQMAPCVFLYTVHPLCKQACNGLSGYKKSPQALLESFFPVVAVRGGFEPPVRLPVRQFSKLVVSATHPSHLSAQWVFVYTNVLDCKYRLNLCICKFYLMVLK